MSNKWLANDLTGNNLYSPTLGDVTSAKTKITIQDVTWPNPTGYLFGQASSEFADREYGMYITSDQVVIRNGGEATVIDSYSNIFENKTDIAVQLLMNSGTYTLIVGDYTLDVSGDVVFDVSATTYTGSYTTGTSRQDGQLFRLGARASELLASAPEGTYQIGSGAKVGDVKIEIDDVLVRHYVMPSDPTSTVVPCLVNSANNMALYAEDDTDFEGLATSTLTISITGSTIPNGTYDVDFYNDTAKELIETRSITFTDSTIDEAFSVNAGTVVFGKVDGDNMPTNGAPFYGVTV